MQVEGSVVTFAGSVTTTGLQSYTGTTSLAFSSDLTTTGGSSGSVSINSGTSIAVVTFTNANVTTQGGSVSLNGSITMATNLIIDSTQGVGAASGAAITIGGVDSTLSGTYNLTVNAGVAAVTVNGTLGVVPLNALTVSSGSFTGNQDITTSGISSGYGVSITSPGFITIKGVVSTTNKDALMQGPVIVGLSGHIDVGTAGLYLTNSTDGQAAITFTPGS